MIRSWYYANHVESKLYKIIEIQLLNSSLPKGGLELKKIIQEKQLKNIQAHDNVIEIILYMKKLREKSVKNSFY